MVYFNINCFDRMFIAEKLEPSLTHLRFSWCLILPILMVLAGQN